MMFSPALDKMNRLDLEWYNHAPKQIIHKEYAHHYEKGLRLVFGISQLEAEWAVYWVSVLLYSDRGYSLSQAISMYGDRLYPGSLLDYKFHWEESLFGNHIMCAMSRHNRWN